MKNLKNIMITHYNDDHIGSLYDFKEKYPSVTIISNEMEAKFISGEVKSEKLVQAVECKINYQRKKRVWKMVYTTIEKFKNMFPLI